MPSYYLRYFALLLALLVGTKCIPCERTLFASPPPCTRFLVATSGQTTWPCGSTRENACTGLNQDTSFFNLAAGDVVCLGGGQYLLASPTPLVIPFGITLQPDPNTISDGVFITTAGSVLEGTGPVIKFAAPFAPSTQISGLTFTNINLNGAGTHIIQAIAPQNASVLLVVSSVTFQDNNFNSSDEGGAIRASGVTLIIDTCKFQNNTVYFPTATTPPVGGAAVSIDTTPITIKSSTFIDNHSYSGKGGAVYAGKGAYAEVQASTFLRNSAGFSGGAIHCEHYLNATNSNFSANFAETDGGALYAGGYAIASSRFEFNAAMGNGSAIFQVPYAQLIEEPKYPFPVSILDSDFVENAQSTAVVLTAVAVEIRRCRFSKNYPGSDVVSALQAYLVHGGLSLFDSEFASVNSTSTAFYVSIAFLNVSDTMPGVNMSRNSFGQGQNSLTLLTSAYGLQTFYSAVQAQGNWFGDASGPLACCNLQATGSGIGIGIDFSHWCLDSNCTQLSDVDVTDTCVAMRCGWAPIYVYVLMCVTILTLIVEAVVWYGCYWIRSTKKSHLEAMARGPEDDWDTSGSPLVDPSSSASSGDINSVTKSEDAKGWGPDVLRRYKRLIYVFKIFSGHLAMLGLLIMVFGVAVWATLGCDKGPICPAGTTGYRVMLYIGLSSLYYVVYFAVMTLVTRFKESTVLGLVLGVGGFAFSAVIQPSVILYQNAWFAQNRNQVFANRDGVTPVNFILVAVSQAPMLFFMFASLVPLFKIASMIDMPELYQLQRQVGASATLRAQGTSLLRDNQLDKSAKRLKALSVFTLLACVGLAVSAALLPSVSLDLFGLRGLDYVGGVSLLGLPLLCGIFGALFVLALFYAVHNYYFTSFVRVGRIICICLVVVNLASIIVHFVMLEIEGARKYSMFKYVQDADPITSTKGLIAVIFWAISTQLLIVTAFLLHRFTGAVLRTMPQKLAANIFKAYEGYDPDNSSNSSIQESYSSTTIQESYE